MNFFLPVFRSQKSVLTVLFVVFFVVTTVSASPKNIISTRALGTGDIVDENTSKAKNQAVSNALILAVQQVMVDEIPMEIVVANFKALSSMVIQKSDSFIKGYRVLAESRLGNHYKVLIEASVSLEKIHSGIGKTGIILDPSNSYKVLLLVAETRLEEPEPQFWWGRGMSFIKTTSDTTLSRVLKKKGFDVLNHSLITQEKMQNLTGENPVNEILSTETALSIGRSFNADVIVIGSAMAEQTQNTMGEERSYTGMISLSVYRVETGEKIGSVLQKSVKVNEDQDIGSRNAIFEASNLAGNDLATTIHMAMKKEENRPTMIEVVIEGTDFFINYAKLNRIIANLEGVKRVKQREKHKDKAIIIVDFVGNAKSLAKSLLAETFDNFGLNISEVTRNHLRLEMIPVSSTLFVR